MKKFIKNILKNKKYLNENFSSIDITNPEDFYFIKNCGLFAIRENQNLIYVWNEHHEFARSLLNNRNGNTE